MQVNQVIVMEILDEASAKCPGKRGKKGLKIEEPKLNTT